LIETRYMAQALRLALRFLLAQGAAGCLAEEICTPADSTYSCCLKQHLSHPAACSATEAEAAAFRPSRTPSATGVAVGTLTVTATLASDEGEVLSEKTLEAVEKALLECAAVANESVNHRVFGGSPTWAQCVEVLSRDSRGRPFTRAMQLGKEKHTEAVDCVKERLSRFLMGRYSVEQRYRRDPETRRLELISPEEYGKLLRENQGQDLKGTLVPDVVIHSGEPLKARRVYDFKFPCLRENPPRWGIYEKGHPYQDMTQGMVYQEVFGSAIRVTPWEIIR
jgi:hypothetical protein